jgi:chromosome partitioning protein
MYNHGTILSKDIEFNLKTQIGDLLFKTKIPQNIKIAESPSFSKPIIYYDSKSAGSIYYREFVNELLERINSEKY